MTFLEELTELMKRHNASFDYGWEDKSGCRTGCCSVEPDAYFSIDVDGVEVYSVKNYEDLNIEELGDNG